MSIPKCKACGRDLPIHISSKRTVYFGYRSLDSAELESDAMVKAQEFDYRVTRVERSNTHESGCVHSIARKPVRGYTPGSPFCTLRCGYRWAVAKIRQETA